MRKVILIIICTMLISTGVEAETEGKKDTAIVKADSISASFVKLVSLAAEYKNNRISLEWETEAEKDNLRFVIERATINDDWDKQNPNYKEIGTEEGNGSVDERRAYNYQDKFVEKGNYLYRLKYISGQGKETILKGIEVDLSTPYEYGLEQNFPNPFNPETSIKFSVPKAGHVSLNVYNTLGQQVKSLINEYKEPGVYSVVFNAEELNSGLYFYRMESNDFAKVRKMTILK